MENHAGTMKNNIGTPCSSILPRRMKKPGAVARPGIKRNLHHEFFFQIR